LLSAGLYYVFGFIVLLGVLIFVHEFGHFIVAKLVGVKVIKFSLGFPPTVVSRKWGETEYCLSWVPLGGYVKLLGESTESDEEIPPEEAHRSFSNQGLLPRIAIIVAGPLFNFLLAVVLLTAGYVAGLPVLVSEVGKVIEGTPAAQAGIQPNDRVVAIDRQPVWRWDDMRSIIEKNAGQVIVLTVKRGEEEIDIPITPALSAEKGPLGVQHGQIGVMQSGKSVTVSFPAAIREGWRSTWHLTELVVITLVKLVKGEISPENLGGPITIMQASGESLRAGLIHFIFLLSYISINLAIINLLPIPILDGGHLMFFLIEAVIRKPVTGKVREMAVQFGLLVIVFLMVLVFYNDIYRIVTKGWSLQP
jgi:regulator of sigma E protease